MMPASLQVEDDCIGQNMIRRPEYNGMVGTVVSIVVERLVIDGEVVGADRRYYVMWADGARSLQYEHQLRALDAIELAAAEVCAANVIRRVSSSH